MRRTLLPALAICVAAGCGSAPGLGTPDSGPFRYATARAICAPWDGPGVAIVLAGDSVAADTPTPPYVEFRIFQSTAMLSGSTLRYSGSSSDSGSVVSCTDVEQCDFVDGELDFGAAKVPGDLTGRYRVRLAGQWIAGSFRARWLPRREMCG
jgi:hypothetical protein